LHNSSITHLAVITVPAAIAMGERMGKSGQDIINAVVAGYDVGARIGDAINPSAYWFWHTTGVAGNFSAAATAGKLLNLDAEQMNHCFGTAGSQAAGLWEFMYDGAMSKTVHVGKACMNGIMAAELASRGFTGATRILEGDKGFVKAVAKEYDLDALTRDFGQPYKVMTHSFQPSAGCRHTHSAIYAIQQLIKEKGLKAENVESILDRTYSTAVDLTDNPTPQTLYGHKFSLQYIIAAALLYGDVLDNVFTEQATTNPLVQETMQKVTVKLDEAIDAEYKASPEKWIHELDIQMKDGQAQHIRVEYPLGDFNNPFDWNMADNKFKNVTAEFLNLKEQEKLLDKIHNLEKIKNINDLFKF
jgi:2-methylcitrate dehydratase PrpD